MTPRGGLVDRALARLRGGPAHTLELAGDVLGLSGPPGAVSTAVFTLLGSDERFRVDPHGVWSLDDAVPAGPSLSGLSYAVVDVETTGGSFVNGHRIIEIAVVEVSGGAVGRVWGTLINPGRPVPPGVRALTGFTDDMVAAAPWFDHLACEIVDRLEGRVFVAHNAAFDWRFVSAELARCVGLVPDVPRLCTVRMARRLVPRLRRRNLDALTRHYGIPILERHRAHGDALATARVLVRLLDEARGRGVGDLPALERLLARRRQGKRGGRPGPRATGRSGRARGSPGAPPPGAPGEEPRG